jgi:hypothetical protein
MLLDRFVVWIGMLVKRFRQQHDEARRAMAASEGACLSEGFLHAPAAAGGIAPRARAEAFVRRKRGAQALSKS